MIVSQLMNMPPKSQKLHLLCVTSDKTEGGIQRALCDWASVLAEQPAITLSALSPENRFTRWLADTHPECRHLPLTSVRRMVIRYLPALAGFNLSEGRGGAIADIALVHNGFACRGARHFARQVIGVCHNEKPHHFTSADSLICLTPAAMSKAKRQGWSEDRLHLIPHFHERRYQAPLDVAPRTAGMRVSAAGRFVAKKNFALFIEIAAQIKALRPDMEFTLAGDGPLAEELKAYSDRLGADVIFPGWTDMESLARKTDLFIVPSSDEPFGYVLAEMMDAGRALLSTPTSGARYILDDGRVAPLIEPDNMEGWIEMILALADDEQKCQALSQRCSDRMDDAAFSRTEFAKKLMGLFAARS